MSMYLEQQEEPRRAEDSFSSPHPCPRACLDVGGSWLSGQAVKHSEAWQGLGWHKASLGMGSADFSITA